MKMSSFRSHLLASTLAASAAIILAGSASAQTGGLASTQTITNIHNFSALHVYGAGARGYFPVGGVVAAGTELYGTTSGGGSGYGEVFKMTTAGATETSIHSFAYTDGANPQSLLLLVGPNLYGTTYYGGANGLGVIFVLSTNATTSTLFTNLHSFSYADGANPGAGLVLAGNTLFGTAVFGGLYGGGSIYSINTNGTDFTNLFSFYPVPYLPQWTALWDSVFEGGIPGQTLLYANATGYAPVAPVTVSGGSLYGTCSSGGATFFGTIFSISTNGTDYVNYYGFSPDAGGNKDGAQIYSDLVVAGGSVYGAAAFGGVNNDGTIFEFNTNTLEFTTLWDFTGVEGSIPLGGPILIDGMLYGGTFDGGPTGFGSVYEISTNAGSTATELTGVATGFASEVYANPIGQLTTNAQGTILYGTGLDGSGDDGNIFSFSLTNSDAFTGTYHSFAASSYVVSNSDGYNCYAGVTQVGNFLYGTASSGGKGNDGCIFKVNLNGTQFTNIYNFTGTSGSAPEAGLLYYNGLLYGTASSGGTSNYGVVFSITTNGTGFTTLHYFTNGVDGADPVGGLVAVNNMLYGTAYSGGAYSSGTVFSVPTNGTQTAGLIPIYNFAGSTDGANPAATLLLNNGVLFGTTIYGGAADYGAVFSVSTNGSGFEDLYTFSGYDGAYPQCQLDLLGTNVIGTTTGGGVEGAGSIFEVSTNGDLALTAIYEFTNGYDGYSPQGQLVYSNGTLYGSAFGGGIGIAGTVFELSPNGSNFTILASFNFTNGAFPQAGVMLATNNTLYGTGSQGSAQNEGSIFSYYVPPPVLTASLDATGTNIVTSWPTYPLIGFNTLVSTTNLTPPVTWTPVPTAPVVLNGLEVVTNPIVDPTMYFSLVNTNQ